MGSKIVGLVALGLALAGLGDVLRNPNGTKAAFNGTNSLLATSYNAAGGYKT